jgi:hypothetical protein
MNENANNGWQTTEAKAKNIAQTKALERKSPAGGPRFEARRCCWLDRARIVRRPQ